jgi:hypothetical protein
MNARARPGGDGESRCLESRRVVLAGGCAVLHVGPAAPHAVTHRVPLASVGTTSPAGPCRTGRGGSGLASG